MTIANRTILVTGANRGLGRPLVEEALRRGADRVYGVERGEDLFPDPMSASMADSWHRGVAKARERQNAAFAQAGTATP